MIKKALSLIILLTASVSLFAAKYTTNIPIKSGERWFGVFVGGDIQQPFLTPFNTANIKDKNIEHTSTLLISTDGRYIWSQHPAEIYFDGAFFIVSSEYEDIQVQKGGKTLRDAYLVCCHKNFPPSGTISGAKLMSKPIYDLSLELGFNSSQEQVIDFAKRILSQNLPIGTIIIADGWQTPASFGTFDNDYYPDPTAMVEQLHSMGFKVILSVSPLIGAYGRNYEAALKNNSLLCDSNGKPLIIHSSDGYASCYDLTNDATFGHISDKLRELQSKYKIDGYKLDCSNAASSIVDKQISKQYIDNWNKLVKISENNIIFTKGVTGDITLSVINTEDTKGYAALARVVKDAITSPLVGGRLRLPTIAPEILENETDEMLQLRAMQLLVSMPMSITYKYPWNFTNPELRSQAIATLEFRKKIESYINECIDESGRSAEPLVRHLAYQFPRNGFTDCYDQFMIGRKFLIVPVLDSGTERIVRFPKGEWICPDGKRYKGPIVKNFNVANGRMLYFELVEK